MTVTMTRHAGAAGSITPTRTRVSRTFPVLGFTVRVPEPASLFEVALATDPALFPSAAAERRTPETFWSSSELGPQQARDQQTVFLVPGRVLQRFAGTERLYFALATFDRPDGTGLRVWRPEVSNAPSVTVESTFGARRIHLMPDGAGPDGYDRPRRPLTWAGDRAADDGMRAENGRAQTPPDTGADMNGQPTTSQNLEAQPFVYDDGLGMDFWAAQPMEQPTVTDPDAIGIDGPVPEEHAGTDISAATALAAQALQAPEYPQASRFTPAGPGHFTQRPNGRRIERIVLHITQGRASINGPIRWFQDPRSNVSSHYIVGQDGEVVQMVRHADIAHHARGANTASIGIEHVGHTENLPFTEAQYCASAALVRWLAEQFGIALDRQHIIGHREVPGTTKTCPGPWDWDYFMAMVTSGTCFPRSSMTNGNGRAAGVSQGSGAAAGRTLGRAATPFSGQSFRVHWDDVQLVPQPDGWSCWAAAAAMVVGWRDRMSIEPATIAADPRFADAVRVGLDAARVDDLARAWELVAEPPLSYTVDGLRSLLETNGPLWVGVASNAPSSASTPSGRVNPHAVTIVGLEGDGTPDGTTVVYHDPWPPTQGRAGVRASYRDVMAQFSLMGSTLPSDGTVYVQLLHAGGRRMATAQGFGAGRARTVTRASAAPAAVPIASAIVGATMNRILNNEGDIEWELDQLNGWKHPGDVARDIANTRRQVLDVPGPKRVLLGDELSADMRITFEYDGRSVGNVSQQITKTNDRIDGALVIRSTIHDVGRLFPSADAPNAHAAIEIQTHYRFTRTIRADHIALRTLRLFGDGTFHDHWEWTS